MQGDNGIVLTSFVVLNYGVRTDLWKNLLQVYTKLVVTQFCVEKMCNKNIEYKVLFLPLSASVKPLLEGKSFQQVECKGNPPNHFL